MEVSTMEDIKLNYNTDDMIKSLSTKLTNCIIENTQLEATLVSAIEEIKKLKSTIEELKEK